MKKILSIIAFLFSTSLFAYGVYGYYPYYYNYSVYSGYPIGWGYVSYPYWPANYWYNPGWNGYSYYSYNNYQPNYVSYGVISYSPEKDVWGSSWAQPNRFQATNVANNNCNDTTCKPVVWVQGGCAVLMTSHSTKRVTWGTGTSRSNAFYAAETVCKSGAQSPTDCKESAWICTY